MSLKNLVLCILLISLAAALGNCWVIHPDNFFYLDDFNWMQVAFSTATERIINILPHAPYNDRPVGILFLKWLFQTMGYHNRWHHIVLLMMHVATSLLLFGAAREFFIAGNKSESGSVISLISAVIFAAWPTSNYAVGWDAAIFDLLGGFLSSLFLFSWFSTRDGRYPCSDTVWLLIVYLLALRTKEMTVGLPVIALIAEIAINFYNNKKFSEIPKFTLVRLSLLGALTLLFLLAIRMANALQPFGEDPSNPYFRSFSALALVQNIGRYAALYYDVFTSSPSVIQFSKFLPLMIIPFVGFLAFAIFSCFRRRYQTALLLLALLVQLAPVLPMVNMQHRLYLYMPGMFFALIGASCIYAAFAWLKSSKVRNSLAIVTSVLLITAVIHFGDRKSYVDWTIWLARENHRGFQSLFSLPKPNEGEIIYVINVPESVNSLHVFAPGKGDALKALFGLKSLSTKSFSVGKPSEAAKHTKGIYLIDYNGGNAKFLGRT